MRLKKKFLEKSKHQHNHEVQCIRLSIRTIVLCDTFSTVILYRVHSACFTSVSHFKNIKTKRKQRF